MFQSDDIVWRVDNHYLGPPGKTLPFPIRMTALWVGITIASTIFIVMRTILHLPMSYNLLLIVAVGTAWLTSRFMRNVTPERPVRAVVRAAMNDLRSPREPKKGEEVAVRYSPHLDADRPTTIQENL